MAIIVIRKFILAFLVVVIFNINGFGKGLFISDIYSANMVMQADEPFVIYGKASSGKKVNIRIQDRKGETIADKNGNWKVKFSEFAEGPVGIIFIESEGETIEINNVLAGEVWLCSGQSNMALPVSKSDVKNNFTTRQIRFFKTLNDPSNVPIDQVKGSWKVCNKDNFNECSAIGFSFALNLNNGSQKPVGLIINAIGGSPIESWTNLEVLKKKSYDKYIFENRENWKKDIQIYEEQYDLKLKKYEFNCRKAKEEGGIIPMRPFPPFQLRENWNPGCLFNSLVYPLRNISLRGIIWYQGESNANYPYVYRYQLVDLIRNWRETFFNNHLPFYIIQLPEYKTDEDWVTMRESQALAANMKNVSLIVTLGLGDSLNIHPIKKMEVGRRVSLQALKNEYKFDIVSEGPCLRKLKIKGDKIILCFNVMGSSIRSADGKPIRNIEISNNGISFLPASVKIKGNNLLVWNSSIANPCYVRYAWKNLPEQINLVNEFGLPAPPFFEGNQDNK